MRPKAAGWTATSFAFAKVALKRLAVGLSLVLAITLGLLALCIAGFLLVVLAFWDWARHLSITLRKASRSTTSPQ